MRLIHLTILFCCLVFTTISKPGFSQNKPATSRDSVFTGSLNGLVFDSAHNYPLQSATVALYREPDSRLISYQLTNSAGEFAFSQIPINNPLRLVISHVSYKTNILTITWKPGKKDLDIGSINLLEGAQELDEVKVFAIVPIRMNKDTLEINPAAFGLDSNAVVEDLLMKVPGVTVWGDGAITVNGRLVKSVLVNGKPFFGGSTKIATQNIPNQGVEKIQIYQQSASNTNTIDSTTELNIKLKDESSRAVFGKVGAGIGTDQRWEADANLNYFNPRTQIAVIAAANNVNKIANEIKTLLENSTFKGVSAEIDYQPDFRRAGISRPFEAGISVQRDLLAQNDKFNVSRISGDYLLAKNEVSVLTNTNTTTRLDDVSAIFRLDDFASTSQTVKHTANVVYERNIGNKSFSFSGALSDNYVDTRIMSDRQIRDQTNQLRSFNEVNSFLESNKKVGIFLANYKSEGATSNSRRLVINNITSIGKDFDDKYVNSRFSSVLIPGETNNLERTYNNAFSYLNNTNTINAANLKSLYIGNAEIFRIGMQNNFTVNSYRGNSTVFDIDSASRVKVLNSFLTTHVDYLSIDELVGLNFQKTFSKTLSNRYSRAFELNLVASGQYFFHRNLATHTIQQFRKSYVRMVPEFNVKFTNYQFGRFQDVYAAKLSSFSRYPTLAQLTSLPDSADIYGIYAGNLSLRPAKHNELVLSMTHNSFQTNNNLSYNIIVKAGLIQDAVSDSILLTSDGRTAVYPVNVNGYRFANIAARLTRSFKIGQNSFQVMFLNTADISKEPGYVNNVLINSQNFTNVTQANIGYYLGGIVALNIDQRLVHYKSGVRGNKLNEYTLSNRQIATSLSASWALFKKLTISSSVSYNSNKSSAASSVDFVIWNANVSARLSKKNNVELKLSAFDLLKQNSNLINYGYKNILTTGTNNALQRYFMLTLSYFPRKF